MIKSLPKPVKKPKWVVVEPGWRHLLTHRFVEFEGETLAYSRIALREKLHASVTALKAAYLAGDGQTCVIAGNGPSLNAVDWSLLEGVPVFASNYAFMHPELAPRISQLTVVNPWVVAQAQKEFDEYQGQVVVPYHLGYWLGDDVNKHYVNFHFGYESAGGLADAFSIRSTVSYFNLQLALCMGYRRIILVGFDHSYEQPKASQEGDILTGGSQDPNHFSPEYFAYKQWQAADVEKMAYTYRLADEYAKSLNAEIINASANTKLNVFRRAELASVLKKEQRPTGDAASSRLDAAPPSVLVNAARILKGAEEMLNRFELAGACTLLAALGLFLVTLPDTSFVFSALILTLSGLGVGLALIGLALGRRRGRDQLDRHVSATTKQQR